MRGDLLLRIPHAANLGKRYEIQTNLVCEPDLDRADLRFVVALCGEANGDKAFTVGAVDTGDLILKPDGTTSQPAVFWIEPTQVGCQPLIITLYRSDGAVLYQKVHHIEVSP